MSFATFSADTIAGHDRLAAIADVFASGWTSVVHEVLPLEKAVLAHQKIAAGEVFGRIVLTPS
jgi:NADPH2:quinone reductase